MTAAMIARSRGLAEPRWAPSGLSLAWIDAFDGRTDIVVAPARGDSPPLVVTGDLAASGSGSYGGGVFAFAGDDELVVAAADGRLAVLPAGGGPGRELARDGRAFAPAVSPDGSRVAFCVERDDTCDVALVPLDGSTWPVRMSRADYAWDPTWSADGRLLAWHEWDLPNMPWDGSRIVVADLSTGERRTIAGGDDVAVGQPRFSPDGSWLAYVDDRSGWSNLWISRPDGSGARPLAEEEHEHAEPSWGPGQRSFAWSPDGTRLAWCRNEAGFGRLVVGEPASAELREVAKGWHRWIDWSVAGITAVRSGARTPAGIVVTAPDGSWRRVVARGPVGGFEAAGLVEPEAVWWRSDDVTVPGLLYRPAVSALGPGTRPPLYVHVHGGPTGQALVEWNPRVAYWVTRGWAVLAPDYRGSSGHGRAYLRALDCRWGAYDVNDVAAGIRHAIAEGWCEPGRVAVAGGSAGGLTVLRLCAEHGDVVRAGVSLYGVTDLLGLAETTHRFESRYLDRIVGPLPEAADRYRDRSPITHAAQVRVPVLVLQGSTDPVVPPAQAEAMVEAMRRAGAPVEYRLYEGEGHGLRRTENVVDELERTEAFLTRWVLRR